MDGRGITRLVLALAYTNRSPGIAIASANFPTDSFGPIIALYAIVATALSLPYMRWQRHRLRAP